MGMAVDTFMGKNGKDFFRNLNAELLDRIYYTTEKSSHRKFLREVQITDINYLDTDGEKEDENELL